MAIIAIATFNIMFKIGLILQHLLIQLSQKNKSSKT